VDGARAGAGEPKVPLSVPEAFSVDEITAMSDDAMVHALANPDPEVRPDEARAARALADLIEEPDAASIPPAALDERVVPAVAEALAGQP
jgi:malic enzyme